MKRQVTKNLDSPRPNATSVERIARYIGASRTKAYELIKTGDLRSFKLGRKRLVTYADADALIERLLHRQA